MDLSLTTFSCTIAYRTTLKFSHFYLWKVTDKTNTARIKLTTVTSTGPLCRRNQEYIFVFISRCAIFLLQRIGRNEKWVPWKTFYNCFLAVIDFAIYLIVARLSHLAAISHVYLPNTFNFSVNIQRVIVLVNREAVWSCSPAHLHDEIGTSTPTKSFTGFGPRRSVDWHSNFEHWHRIIGVRIKSY